MNKMMIPENSFEDFCGLLADLSHGTATKRSSNAVYQTPVSFWYSRLFLRSLDANALTEVLEDGAISGGPAFICCTDEQMPENMDTIMEANGYTLFVRQEGMIYPVIDVASAPPNPHIERIDSSQIEEWSRVVSAGFGKPEELKAMDILVRCPECEFYAYRKDDKIVATLLSYTKSGNTGIHEVSVLPEYRRQGIANAMVAHALTCARMNNSDMISLQASPDGAKLYKSMGFESVSHVSTWIRK